MNDQNGNPKPVLKERDWGYTIGGPVGKPGGSNKLFFFYSEQFSPRTSGGAVNRFRVPTLLERQGDFSQTTDNTGARFNLIRDASTQPALHGGRHARLFPGWRRAGPHSAEPAVSAGRQHPEDLSRAQHAGVELTTSRRTRRTSTATRSSTSCASTIRRHRSCGSRRSTQARMRRSRPIRERFQDSTTQCSSSPRFWCRRQP